MARRDWSAEGVSHAWAINRKPETVADLILRDRRHMMRLWTKVRDDILGANSDLLWGEGIHDMHRYGVEAIQQLDVKPKRRKKGA